MPYRIVSKSGNQGSRRSVSSEEFDLCVFLGDGYWVGIAVPNHHQQNRGEIISPEWIADLLKQRCPDYVLIRQEVKEGELSIPWWNLFGKLHQLMADESSIPHVLCPHPPEEQVSRNGGQHCLICDSLVSEAEGASA